MPKAVLLELLRVLAGLEDIVMIASKRFSLSLSEAFLLSPMTQANSIHEILHKTSNALLQVPNLGRSVVGNRTLRVLAVSAVAVCDAWDTLPGQPLAPSAVESLLYYYISGRCEDKTNEWFYRKEVMQHLRFQRSSAAETQLWRFIFTEGFRAAVDASNSEFLKEILAVLDRAEETFQTLCQELERHKLATRTWSDKLIAWDSRSFFDINDDLDNLVQGEVTPANKVSKLKADFKKKVLEGKCNHFLDAKIQWLYDLLHNDKLKDELCAKFAKSFGPITLLLHSTKAPCDLCALTIVQKYPELVKRFDAADRGLKISVSTSAVYGENIGCVGLARLSESNDCITFCYLDQGIDSQIDICKMGFAR